MFTEKIQLYIDISIPALFGIIFVIMFSVDPMIFDPTYVNGKKIHYLYQNEYVSLIETLDSLKKVNVLQNNEIKKMAIQNDNNLTQIAKLAQLLNMQLYSDSLLIIKINNISVEQRNILNKYNYLEQKLNRIIK